MSLDQFSCPNSSCPEFRSPETANINIHRRYGRKQVRLLICNSCGKTFSEFKGTPFWDSRLEWDTIEKIYRTLLDGQGIRATARLHNLSKNTVKRYLRLAGEHFLTIEEFLANRGGLPSTESNQFKALVDRHIDRSITFRTHMNRSQ